MITVKDLFENEELMRNIVEDIEDIPEDAEVLYVVWALGCDTEDEPTDAEYLIGEFTDPDEAVKCAKEFTLEKFNAEYEKPCTDTAYLSIEVETVVGDPDDEDGGTMNIGTVYSKVIWLDGPKPAEDIIAMVEEDYELLEDGTLKVRCELLKDFNKNDIIRVQFVGEPNVGLLPYKIMSKVIYEDGDYYHLELMI
jgi:hypothetical protein